MRRPDAATAGRLKLRRLGLLWHQPDGRMAAVVRFRPNGRGKSGLLGNTVPGNARRGRPQGQCHRKQTAGRGAQGSPRACR